MKKIFLVLILIFLFSGCVTLPTEEECENIHFIGRLASYKYFNMDQAIKNSLDYYKKHFDKN